MVQSLLRLKQFFARRKKARAARKQATKEVEPVQAEEPAEEVVTDNEPSPTNSENEDDTTEQPEDAKEEPEQPEQSEQPIDPTPAVDVIPSPVAAAKVPQTPMTLMSLVSEQVNVIEPPRQLGKASTASSGLLCGCI